MGHLIAMGCFTLMLETLVLLINLKPQTNQEVSS